MKAVKILGGIVAAVVLIVGVVIFLGLQNLNQIVKTAVETVGPDVVGTEVRLAGVDIEITNGRGELSGLTIANPKGFSNNNAFELGTIALQVDPSSLSGDVVVIDEILISGAHLLAEQKNLTETNLQALMNNMQGGTSVGSGENTKPAASDSSSSVKLAVKKFTFSDSNIQVVTQEWGERTIKLPSISVADIGSKDAGLTPEQLAQAMIQPVLKAAEKSVKRDLEKLAKEKLEEKAKEKLKEKLGDEKLQQIDQLKSLFGK
ncbi:MAG: hypothetical protein VXZ35_14790 [Pseudomonadota bacterium]|nr:hypothetical protein [Pseudomonadota bacterium]